MHAHRIQRTHTRTRTHERTHQVHAHARTRARTHTHTHGRTDAAAQRQTHAMVPQDASEVGAHDGGAANASPAAGRLRAAAATTTTANVRAREIRHRPLCWRNPAFRGNEVVG